jgi:hypothetical protein
LILFVKLGSGFSPPGLPQSMPGGVFQTVRRHSLPLFAGPKPVKDEYLLVLLDKLGCHDEDLASDGDKLCIILSPNVAVGKSSNIRPSQ